MKKIVLIYLLLIASNNYSQTNLINVPEVWEVDTWNGANWNLVSQVTYTYSSNCLATEGLAKFKDIGGSEMLENASFLTITYNANDLPIESINQLWDEDISTWEDQLKTEFTYTGTNLTGFINYDWLDNNWEPSNRELITYSTSGLVTENISQTWDETNNIWMNISKTEYTYNPNQTFNIETTYNWNSSNNTWVNDLRAIYVYTNNLLTSKKSDTWNTSNWENHRIRIYSYDSNDFLIETLKTKWNGSAYDNDGRILRTNNSDGFPTEMINQTWLFGFWLNTSRDRRTYPDCLTLSVQNTEKISDNIYPNPATSVIYIDSLIEGNYTLINVNGQVLQKGNLSNGKNLINIDYLSEGMYFININSGSARIVKKIIKQ